MQRCSQKFPAGKSSINSFTSNVQPMQMAITIDHKGKDLAIAKESNLSLSKRKCALILQYALTQPDYTPEDRQTKQK
jgi:hypothetical protein